MTKQIFTWIKYVVVIAVIIGIPFGAKAQRFIYYCGDYNGWPEPIQSNAAKFDGYRLYETEAGSNVYSGIVSPNGYASSRSIYTYFSFFTELSSDEDYQDGLDVYCTNRVIPILGYDDDTSLRENTDDYVKPGHKFDFIYTPYITEKYRPMSWAIYLPEVNAPLKLIVDFNNNTVSAITDIPVLVVNDNVKPTIDNINEYAAFGRQVFVPMGECRFYAYNLFRDKFYSLSAPTEVKTTSVKLDYESSAICTVPNWGGGTLSIDAANKVSIRNNYQSLNNENPFANWGETAYIIGSFTEWMFSEAYKMKYADGVFYGNIPANAGQAEFVINDRNTWSNDQLRASVGEKTVVGNTIFYTASEDVSNIAINVTEEMNVSFEPARRALKIWPARQTEPDPEPEGFFDDNKTKPEIPQFTGIILEHENMFVDLTKAAPSEVGIENLTAFKCTPVDGRYQFTLDGGINKPFRFLEFKDDKLVRVFQPINDVSLLWVGDTAHGNIVTDADGKPTYWKTDKNGKVTVTIDPQSNDLNSITFKMPSLLEPKEIYLIGTPNSWIQPSKFNIAILENYKLKQTNDGKYYGAFDIAAGEVQFVFVKELDDWATPSIRSADDISYDFIGSTISLPLTTQENAPVFSLNWWDGGMLYMLVDERGRELLLSREPIDVTYFGEIIEQPDGLRLFDSVTGSYNDSYQAKEDGIYDVNILYSGNRKHGIKIVRTKHTFSDDEPDYMNSYTLTFADTKLTPGEDGVAETSFTFNDGVNVGAGNEIEIESTSKNFLLDFLVEVDFNTGKIYFNDDNNGYVIGSNTNGRIPTYATRKDFAGCRLPNDASGLFVNLPEGEARLEYFNFRNRNNNKETVEVTFDNEGIAKTDCWSTLNYPDEVILHNCPGGKIFFSRHRGLNTGLNYYMIDLDKIKTFDAVAEKWNQELGKYEYTKLGQLTLSDPATLTYSGCVKVPKPDGPGYPSFKMIVNSDDDFAFGAPSEWLYIDPKTKTANYSLDPNALYQYFRFYNVAEPTVNITLSLKNMNVLVQLVEGEALNGLSVNTNTGDVRLAPVTDPSNIHSSVTVNPDTDGIISINLTSTDGSVIVPTNGDKEMVFDADGVFTDDFTVIQAPSEAVRRTPLTAGKWYYRIGEENGYDVLDFNFDFSNNKVTFVSETSAANIYAVAANDNATITDVEDVRPGTFKPNGDGTLSTKVHVEKGQKLYIVGRTDDYYIRNGLGYGISPRAINKMVIDFNSEETDIPVIPFIKHNTQCNGWTIENNPGCDVQLTYNPAMMMLHVDMDIAGVEDVAADESCEGVEPIYYNLQGVRINNPENGHIYIEVRGNKARKIVRGY